MNTTNDLRDRLDRYVCALIAQGGSYSDHANRVDNAHRLMLATDEKLREMGEAERNITRVGTAGWAVADPLLAGELAEITRLREENAKLNFELEHLHAVEIDMEDAQQELARLRELNDELVGALEVILNGDMGNHKTASEYGGYVLDEDIREIALAALAKAKGDDGEDPPTTTCEHQGDSHE